jgi:hypothetical protein
MLANKKELSKQGYLLVDSNVPDYALVDAQDSFKFIYKRAKKGLYKYIRVYDDYLWCPNISGIEMPLHPDILTPEILNLLNKTPIPLIAKEILGFNIKLTLSRYHVTNTYSHIGDWHRDSHIGDNSVILASIFLFDEKGLELVPGSHNERHNSIYLNSIHLDVKAGQILFFRPAILHRGISVSDRANIHFRFEIDPEYFLTSNNTFEGFNSNWLSILHNKNTVVLNPKINKYECNKKTSGIIKRIIRTAAHYLFFFLPGRHIVFQRTCSAPSLKVRKFFRMSGRE